MGEHGSQPVKSDVFSDFSFGKDYIKELGRSLDNNGISPKKFPNVIDLYSGTGTVAALLKDKGWNSKDITCIDRLDYPNKRIRGAHWVIEDLDVMSDVIASMKGKFDAVFALQSPVSRVRLLTLADFFAKTGGVAILEADYFKSEELAKLGWKRFGDSHIIIQKS